MNEFYLQYQRSAVKKIIPGAAGFGQNDGASSKNLSSADRWHSKSANRMDLKWIKLLGGRMRASTRRPRFPAGL
jgi:hypothetical protein